MDWINVAALRPQFRVLVGYANEHSVYMKGGTFLD
jgi:hypothetical protein